MGRVVLVTGAAAETGAAVAGELANQGVRPVLTGREDASLRAVQLDPEGHA